MSSLNLLADTELDSAFISDLYVDTIQVNTLSNIQVNSDINFNNNISVSNVNLDQFIKNQITATGALTYDNTSGEIHGITLDNYNRSVALSLTGTTILSADLVSGTGQALILYFNYSQMVGSNRALSITPTNTSQTILATTIPGNTTLLIETFEILQATLAQSFIPSGIFDLNVFTAESNANDGLLLYGDIIVWDGVSETIIATTDQIEVIAAYPSVSELTISAVNVLQRAFTSGYSLRIKLYGINNRGSSHTLYTYWEGSGATYSHLHTPFNSTLAAAYTGISPISISPLNEISISESGTGTSGFLSNTNFNIFNNKQNQLGATTPLNLAGTTLSILESGVSTSGFLSSSNFNFFNNKQNQLGATTPLNLAGTTLSILESGVSTSGFLSSSNFNFFNNKQNQLGATTPLNLAGTTLSILESGTGTSGFLSNTNFNLFNSKQNQLGATTPLNLAGTTLSILQSGTTTSGFLSSTDYNTFINGASKWTQDITNQILIPNANAYGVQFHNTNTIVSPPATDTGIEFKRTVISGSLSQTLKQRLGGVKDGYLIHTSQSSGPVQWFAGAQNPGFMIGGSATDFIEDFTALHIKQSQNAVATTLLIEHGSTASNASRFSNLRLKDFVSDYAIQTGGNTNLFKIRDVGASTDKLTLTPNSLNHFGNNANLCLNNNASLEIAGGTNNNMFLDFHSLNASVQDYDGRIIVNGGTTGTPGQGSMSFVASNFYFTNPVNYGTTTAVRTYNTGGNFNIDTGSTKRIEITSAGKTNITGRVNINWASSSDTAAVIEFTPSGSTGFPVFFFVDALLKRFNMTASLTIEQGVLFINHSSLAATLGIDIRNDSTVSNTTRGSHVKFTARDTVNTVKPIGGLISLPQDINYIDSITRITGRRANVADFNSFEIRHATNDVIIGLSTNAGSSASLYLINDTSTGNRGGRFHYAGDGNLYFDLNSANANATIFWRLDNTNGATAKASLNNAGDFQVFRYLIAGQLPAIGANDVYATAGGTLSLQFSDVRTKKAIEHLKEEEIDRIFNTFDPIKYFYKTKIGNKDNNQKWIGLNANKLDPAVQIIHKDRKVELCYKCQCDASAVKCENICTCDEFETIDAYNYNSREIIAVAVAKIKQLEKTIDTLKSDLTKERIAYKTIKDNQNKKIEKQAIQIESILKALNSRGIFVKN